MSGRIATYVLDTQADLARVIREIFGRPTDPLSELERRAEMLLPGRRAVIWEGDPQTFQFSYVSPHAEEVFGYDCRRWTSESDFWVSIVVHPEDRTDAAAFCALATGQGRDHDFQYRALRADGSTRVIHDMVQVVKGPKGLPAALRGVMIDVTEG
jgi:PAS domain S-box-containing protein